MLSDQNIAVTIGQKLRKARKQRDMTLKEVADRTGISQSMLSQIERGIASPTIVSLVAVANALSLSPAFFFEDDVLLKDDELNPIFRKDNKNTLNTETGMTLVPLTTTTDLEENTIQLAEIFLEPGAYNRTQLTSHEGIEKLALIKGSLIVEIGSQEYRLEEGDSINIKTTCPHRLFNPGKESAHGIWLIITPRFP